MIQQRDIFWSVLGITYLKIKSEHNVMYHPIGKRKFENSVYDLTRGIFELNKIKAYTSPDNGHQVYAVDTPMGGIELGEPRHLRVDNELNLRCKAQNGRYPQLIDIGVTDGYYSSFSPESYVFSFTPDAFEKCVDKVHKKIKSDLWENANLYPLLTIIDLLLLKIEELEKRIKQLENPLIIIWF